MECLIGMVGKDFVLLASDTSATQSIIVLKKDEDKVVKIGETAAMAVVGPGGDGDMFGEYISANLRLYSLRHGGMKLSTRAAANYTRGELAKALRSRNAYQTNVLIAGWDEDAGASLYFLDYLSTLHKQNTAAHGYGAFFSLALLDKSWSPDLSVEEAVNLMKKCVDEVQTRLVVAPAAFNFTLIDKDGVRRECTYPEVSS